EDEARRSAFRAMNAMQSVSPCGLESVRPIDDYAVESRDKALRTVGALTVVINSLAGVPGHRALLFVSDGISITPGEELFQAIAETCGGATEPSESSTGNVDIVPRGGDGGPRYDPQQAALDAQKYSIAKRFEDLAAHASANRVTLYTLQASGLQGFASTGVDVDPGERRLLSRTVQLVQTSNLKGSLTALAIDTGGRAMLDANDLGPELARMQEDFDSYYSLGYTTAHHGDGRQHKVEVKVKRPGLRVRYRPSYRDKPAMEKAVDRTLTALLHGIEDNPLEVAIELGEQTLDKATGTWAVPVRLKIPLYKLAIIHPDEGGAFQGRLRLLVTTQDSQGGTSPVRQAAVPAGTGLDRFAKRFPERCFDVGIAEQHAVTFAAGMATEGLKPFCAIYSTFLQRAYDQVVHDVAIQRLPVRFAMDRAGLVGADGPTHAGSFDIAYLGCLPGFVLMAPSDEAELVHMVATAVAIDDRPSALRYPRGEGVGA